MDLITALSKIQWNLIENAGKRMFVTNIMTNPVIMAIVFEHLEDIKRMGYSLDERGCLSKEAPRGFQNPANSVNPQNNQQVVNYRERPRNDDIADLMNVKSFSKLEPDDNKYGPHMKGPYHADMREEDSLDSENDKLHPAPYHGSDNDDEDFDAAEMYEDVEEVETPVNVDLLEYNQVPVIKAMTANEIKKRPIGQIRGSLNRLVEIIDDKEDKTTKEELENIRKKKIERIVTKTTITHEKELFPYQINHVKILVHALRRVGIAIDASDTGTGKTHCALVSAENIGCNIIIMCPKPVIAVWESASKLHKFAEYDKTIKSTKRWFYCSNYEQFKNGNTPFVRVKVKGKEIQYRWKVPANTIVVVDECHKFKNYKTQNFIMIDSLNYGTLKENKVPLLMLSATLVDKLSFIYPIGKLSGLFSSYLDCRNWIKNQIIKTGKNNVDAHCMNLIHEHIFPKYGSRMRISEIGDMFPENSIIYEPCTTSSDNKDVDEIYKKMMRRIRKIIKSKGASTHILVQLLRARQAAELTKIPPILEMVDEYLDEGCSVVIFVNFNDTLEHLAVSLKTDCIISGENPEQREQMIAKFQSDKSRVIICNIQSGGVGISLHDLNGKYPRRSIIVPSWNAMSDRQALGRIWRAGGKTKCIQKILYCPNTIEETIVNLIKEKFSNIDSVNDGSGTSLDLFNETMKRMGIKHQETKEPKEPKESEDKDELYENVEQDELKIEKEEGDWHCIVSVEYVKNTEDLDVVFTIKKMVIEDGELEPNTFQINSIIKRFDTYYKKGTHDDDNILSNYGVGIIKKKNIRKMSHDQYLKLDKQHNDSTNIWYSWNDILLDNYVN